jgi:peptidyl-prolyl cis-trans isomerase SurA
MRDQVSRLKQFCTQDPGSKGEWRFYKMNRNSLYKKEFKDVAFSLAEGEISAPLKLILDFILYIFKK